MILMRMGDKDENCFIGVCGGVEIRFSAALCIIIKQKHLCFGFNGKAAVVFPQRLLKSLEFMPQAFLLRG